MKTKEIVEFQKQLADVIHKAVEVGFDRNSKAVIKVETTTDCDKCKQAIKLATLKEVLEFERKCRTWNDLRKMLEAKIKEAEK